MTLDCSPELKIASGSDGVMAWEMLIKGGHSFWFYGKTLQYGLCEASVGKENHVMHQQGKKTMWTISKDPVMHYQGKKSLQSLSLVYFFAQAAILFSWVEPF